MLKAIVNFLNLKLELLNYFDLTRCLCELKTKGDVIAPKEYIANGEFQNIDFDSSDGVSYWRLRDPITVSREANPNKALKRVQTTVPMKLVFSVRRDKLTTDDAYSFDRIRQTVVKQFNIDNGALTTALGAAKVTITAPSSDGDPLSVWDAETSGTETQEPDFKFVFGSIDIDIVIDSDTECLPTECDDVDSDILHTFDFCDAAVRDRLTAAQVTCLEDALCGVCADATVQLNGSTIGTIASGATDTFPVTQDGSPVGSWNGNAWIIPPATGGATLTIGVFSDAGLTIPITSADFGDTVYIKLAVTGITATNYRFFVCDTGLTFTLDEQASDTLAWEVVNFNNIIIYAEADDGSVIGASLDSFELTINADADANAFVAAHNAITGLEMNSIQQQVVQNIYQYLKGAGTTNNSDLWTYFRSNVNSRWLPLIPVNNTAFDVGAYSLDLIWLNAAATFNGMVISDFSVNGVFGGASKALSLDVAPSDFPLSSVAVGSYARTVVTNSPTRAFGAADSSITSDSIYLVLNRSGQARCSLNMSSFSGFSYAQNSQGSWLANRPSATSVRIKRNGTLLGDANVAPTSRSSQNMYFHAANVGGTITDVWVGELCSYIMVEGLTLAQEEDVEFIQQYIQANVITGGRNV